MAKSHALGKAPVGGSGGIGDVVGPASATDNAIARYDGTTGKLIQNSAAILDNSGNIYALNFVPTLIAIPTAAGTTVLTAASLCIQVFTGVTTQTVTLPVVSSLPQIGFGFWIVNDSSGAVTVNSSGGNAVQIVAANSRVWVFAVLLTGTSAASWDVTYVPAAIAANIANTPAGSIAATTVQAAINELDAEKIGGNATNNLGYLNIPLNSQSDNYTGVLGDSGKRLYQTGASKTFTIPANGSVAYPIGTCLSFGVSNATGVQIAITTDTMYWADDGSTGTRTLAARGSAVAQKVDTTVWEISGVGLS